MGAEEFTTEAQREERINTEVTEESEGEEGNGT
jgi:hypothetical protein